MTGLPVGAPYKHSNVKIITTNPKKWNNLTSKDWEEIQMPSGQIGEIIVSGPHVLDNYFQNPEAMNTQKVRYEQTVWHRTGDSGFIQNEQLYLTGRCKQLIVKGNRTYAPFIIENQISEIEGITCGTLLIKNHNTHLVVESTLSKKNLTSLTSHLEYDTLTRVKNIPKDPRHHSKIDYEQLSRLIQ